MTDDVKYKDIFQSMFQTSVEGILVVNKDGYILMANPACETLFGYHSETLSGEHIDILIPEKFRKQHKKHTKKPKARVISKDLDLYGIKKNGTQFSLDISLSPTSIDGENLTIAFLRDATKSKEDLQKIIQVNEKLTESDRKHNILLNNLQGIVYRCKNNRDWTMEFISEGCLPITGYLSEDFLNGNVHFSHITFKEDQEHVWNDTQKAIKNKKPFQLNYRIKDKKGNIKYLSEKGRGIFNKKGKLEALEGFISDVTAIKKRKELLYQYLNTASSIFLVINANHKIEFANRKACEVLKLLNKEIIGKDWFDSFIPKRNRKQLSILFNQIVKGEIEPPNAHTNIILVGNQEKLIQWRNGILKDDKTGQISITSSGVDVTEEKRMERELQDSRDQLEAYSEELEEKVEERTEEVMETVKKLVEINLNLEDQILVTKQAESDAIVSRSIASEIAKNFPNGFVAVMDKDLKVVFAEGEAIAQLGLKQFSTEGIAVDDITVFAEERKAKINESIKKTLSGQHLSFEINYKNRFFAVNTSPLLNENTEITNALLVYTDISEQKNIEFSIESALKKERELNELKSRFVSMASHEFRTPLSAILTSAILIGKQNEPGKELKREKYLAQIEKNVNNLVVILNDFLSLSKIEEGKIVVTPERFDLISFSNSVVKESKIGLKIGQTINLNSTFKTVLVNLDAKLLRHVFMNLLSNASKYSSEGANIDFKISQNPHNVFIQISDQGIGIPEDEQSHLFQRFYRAKNANNIEGTGLGLNIVKNYTELIGGTIGFKSELNIGSTFWVGFPL
jgi:PAS domain S-box-containing protein